MDLNFYQTLSGAVVHFEVIPAERVARVVVQAPALQEDFGASGGQLLDPDQKPERLDRIRNRVDAILQAPHRKELEEDLLQCQRKRYGK